MHDRIGYVMPSPRGYTVMYPKSFSEFEVQAFLYTGLKNLGLDVRGEVSASGGKFDLVIYDAGKPSRIIEVKKGGAKRCALIQVFEYRENFGLPVDLVIGMNQAIEYIAKIAEVFEMRRRAENAA